MIALLLTEKVLADRSIRNLVPMAGLVLVGIAEVGPPLAAASCPNFYRRVF